jgi:tetratricopeptide (TPR) repeat protein
MKSGDRFRADACPPPDVWVRMALRHCAPDESDELLLHASRCSDCAGRLKDVMDGVQEADEADEHDEVLIRRLAIETRGGRRKLAAKMARSSNLLYWIMAAAILIICLGGGALYLKVRSDRQPPFGLLAGAYTSQRTMEMRLSGADYAPFATERGEVSLTKIPMGLLEGQLLIKQHLERNGDDPLWLHAQGRAQLLVWEFDEALHSFQIAADLGANSPDFLIDYGTAYYQRAERNSAAIDYARAVEKLGLAIQQRPDDPVALFNRAIAYGKLHQYESAIGDLEQCIRLEKRPGWRAEAERRLDEFRQRRSSLLHPRIDQAPAELKTELAFETAMNSAFRGDSGDLAALAAAFENRHHDPWLGEILRLPSGPDWSKAIEILSGLAQVRTSGSNDYSRLRTGIAWVANARMPKPLGVWRDYELLYRDTRAQAVTNCPDPSPLLEASRDYPWFEAQSFLESSLCDVGVGDFDTASAKLDEAERISQQFGLSATLIRIPNFRGQRLVETGFFREALETATDALRKIESGGYPIRRAYDFHAIVVLAATQMNLPNTGYGASSMMISIAEQTGSPLWQMIGQCRRAAFALALGRRSDAETGFRAARTLFQNMSDVPAARPYWRSAEVRWLEMHRDRAGLYRMLREALGESSTLRKTLYFDRNVTAALCRLGAQDGDLADVEPLAEEFWRDLTQGAGGERSNLRAFRPEIESVSQSLTLSWLNAGRTTEALAAWHRFMQFDEQLLAGRTASEPRRVISEGVLTVAPLVGDAGGLWYCAHGDCAFHWAVGGYSDLVRRTRRLRRLCSLSTIPTQTVASEARGLYDRLFPAGTGDVPHVFLNVRGELNTLPLQIFLQFETGKFTSFSFLPFGGAELRTPGIQANSKQGITIVAATDFDPKLGLQKLPEIDQEIAGIRGSFQAVVILHGRLATAAALEQAAMTSDMLHFAGHAIPWRGGIGLVVEPDLAAATPDGRIGIWNMARPRQIRARLVVFSACKTGSFEDAATVQPGQLPVSALLAGARQVVATLWDVNSAAAAAWTKSFYSHLSQGEPAAKALQEASEDVRSVAEWDHPRYWAAFSLYEQ